MSDMMLLSQDPRMWILVIFWFSCILVIPMAVLACRVWRPVMDLLFVVLIWSLCHPNLLGISFFTDPLYRAAIRGFEVHLADLIAIVLAIAMLMRWREYRPRWILPFTVPYALMLILGFLSWVVAEHSLAVPGVRQFEGFTARPPDIEVFSTGIYPLYELFRIVRGFFLFWVVANFIRDRWSLKVFCTGIVVTVSYAVVYALIQRYAFGQYRVAAGLMHPNDFGVFCGMLGAVLLPLTFQAKNTYLSLLYGFLATALIAVVVMTVSRSAVVAYVAAIAATLLFALRYHRSGRNGLLLGLGVLGLAFVLAVGYDTLLDRFYYRSSIEGSLVERNLFNEQAVLMAQDHFLGVGLGNFSAWSWEKYADLMPLDVEPGVPAHNIFYLTLGELGYLGLILLLAIWVRFYQLSWRAWKWNRYHLQGALLFGIFLASVVLMSQSLVHFSYRNHAVYYLLQVYAGVMVGIYFMNRQEHRAARQLRELKQAFN